MDKALSRFQRKASFYDFCTITTSKCDLKSPRVVPLQSPSNLLAAHPGQYQIDQQEGNFSSVFLPDYDGLLAIAGFQRAVTMTFQRSPRQEAHGGFIFHKEDGFSTSDGFETFSGASWLR